MRAEWWMSRVLKIKTYMALDPIPVPLNFPVLIYRMLCALCRGRSYKDGDNFKPGMPFSSRAS
ncbi:MAG: hypothetical protein SGPRY_002844 [Prymnesium sp.]